MTATRTRVRAPAKVHACSTGNPRALVAGTRPQGAQQVVPTQERAGAHPELAAARL
jgi:hypothetical protein